MNDFQDRQENTPLLELRDVSHRYSQGTINLDVLMGASLTVLAGEMKALVGPSGSGKSTLLNIAGLLELPNAGEVFIGGMNASKLSRSKQGLLRRNDIGFVFQFHRLLPEFSAMENIMIPQMLTGLDRDEAAERADQLLGMVGLQARADFRPGLLSGGEQQRWRLPVLLRMRRGICWRTNQLGTLTLTQQKTYFITCQLLLGQREPLHWW